MRILSIISIVAFIVLSCNRSHIKSNPLYEDCPFAGLEFSYVEEVDSIYSTRAFNDSLKAGVDLTVANINKFGDIANSLTILSNKIQSYTRKRKIQLDDQEFISFLQSRTKAICGLYKTINENNTFNAENRAIAENLLLDLVKELGSYEYIKQERVSAASLINGPQIVTHNQSGGSNTVVNKFDIPPPKIKRLSVLDKNILISELVSNINGDVIIPDSSKKRYSAYKTTVELETISETKIRTIDICIKRSDLIHSVLYPVFAFTMKINEGENEYGHRVHRIYDPESSTYKLELYTEGKVNDIEDIVLVAFNLDG